MVLGLTVNAWAVDYTKVTQESMDVFVELFPQYQDLLKELDVAYDENNPMMGASAYRDQIGQLLDQYGITWEEFPVLLQKVTMGYANLQMQQSGMPAGMMNMMGQMGKSLSESEMDVIGQYADQLQQIFSEE